MSKIPTVTMATTAMTEAGSTQENGVTTNERLGKRLTYLLRYGAEKEGLEVSSKGFVKLDDLMCVPLLHRHTREQVLKEIEMSLSYRGTKRFAQRSVNGEISVRATYGHRFERNPYHEGSKVPRLLEQCMNHICNHIADYSLEDCPDEYLIGAIIHKLKRQKRLTNTALQGLLGPTIETLDLGWAYVTEGSLKIIMRQCPHLKELSLRECGYLMTDQLVQQLVKRLPQLTSLNLYACNHLTSASLRAIAKRLGPQMLSLNISQIPNYTNQDILDFLDKCPQLEFLDFHGSKVDLTDEFCVKLAQICETREVKIVNR
ncbi:uncharacterized protein [Amphiura filiformis]|uniref:uncharacterized protein n=1 Tax=Amphiura filiformis TaxID=82378 RepID=UPI003B2236E1